MRCAFSFVYLSIVDRSEKCWPMSFVVIFSFDKPFLHWLFSVSILVPCLHLLVIRKAEELIYSKATFTQISIRSCIPRRKRSRCRNCVCTFICSFLPMCLLKTHGSHWLWFETEEKLWKLIRMINTVFTSFERHWQTIRSKREMAHHS